jgi:probable rRNA maturation factor
MFSYNILWNSSFEINKKSIDKIFNIISNSITKKQNWILNIIFLDDNSIKNLNKNYRNVDSITDVLSFHYFDDFSKVDKKDIVWEILLSENKIISQWREYGLGSEKEFYKLLIHSILHILWYDHEKESDYKIMQELEEKVWEEVFK